MTAPELIDVAKEGLWTYARIAGPLMVSIMFVGVIISFFQAITQIQEQTLTFVPKMALTGLGLYFLLSFIGDSIFSYMTHIAYRISQGG